MTNTVQQLYNLNSPETTIRRGAQAYFQNLRLQPQHFLREVTSMLQTNIQVPYKKLSLMLLYNFVSQQEHIDECRKILSFMTQLYFQDQLINASVVSKLFGLLLSQSDESTRLEFGNHIILLMREVTTYKRAFDLMFEIFDDNVELEIPLNYTAIHEISNLSYDVKKHQLGIMVMLSIRNKFAVNNSFTLEQALSNQNYQSNKTAMISFLLRYIECPQRTNNELSQLYQFMYDKYYSRTQITSQKELENVDIVIQLSKLSSILLKQMLARTTFYQEPPFLQPQFIKYNLMWAHMYITWHPHSDVLYTQMLSNTHIFVISGFEYLLQQSVQYFLGLIATKAESISKEAARLRQTAYLILSSLMSETLMCGSQTNDLTLIRLALDDLNSDSIENKLGVLSLLQSHASRISQSHVFAHDIHISAMNQLATKLSVEQFQVVLKIILGFPQLMDEEMFISIFQFTDGHDDDTRLQMLHCIESQFQEMQIDQQMLHVFLDVFDSYNYQSLPVKSALLELLAIMLSNYPQAELGLLFSDVYTRLVNIQPVETIEFDSYCEAWRQLLKIYNQQQYQSSTFIQDSCAKVQIFLAKTTDSKAAEFLMEMIDLPPEHLSTINRLRDLLLSRLPFQDQRLYDLLEIYTILYPKTSAQKSTQILLKLQHCKEYYRFYFRLPPNTPLQPPNFCPSNIIEVKWVLLSMLNSIGRLRDFNLSKQNTDSIESLAKQIEKLSIVGTTIDQYARWINLLMTWKDNENHWFSNWPKNHLSWQLQKDFNRWTKSRILKLLPSESRPKVTLQIDY